MEDALILKTLKNGDLKSFEHLVNCYEREMYGFIYNIVYNSDIAQDLTQDTFIKIYENLYKYDSKYPIEPWMFKIAYNITMNYLKKNKYTLKELPLSDELLSSGPIDNSIDEFETKQIILNEIKTLKVDCRAIFYLRIIEDLSFEQIAKLLDSTAAAVKLKFYRNRKHLITKLGQYFNEVI